MTSIIPRTKIRGTALLLRLAVGLTVIAGCRDTTPPDSVSHLANGIVYNAGSALKDTLPFHIEQRFERVPDSETLDCGSGITLPRSFRAPRHGRGRRTHMDEDQRRRRSHLRPDHLGSSVLLGKERSRTVGRRHYNGPSHGQSRRGKVPIHAVSLRTRARASMPGRCETRPASACLTS